LDDGSLVERVAVSAPRLMDEGYVDYEVDASRTAVKAIPS
jgi:hypothetical protein